MNERDELERVIAEVLAGVQAYMQSGQQLSPALQQQLTTLIESATERLRELSEEEAGIGAGEIEPEINENLRYLWELSGGQPNAFVSYLREFPHENFSALLNNPSALAQVIEYLERNHPVNRNEIQDGIAQAPLQSSNVYGFRFNPKDKSLQVRFQSGSVYQYGRIPPQIFNLFANGNASARTQGRNRWGSWWRGKNPSLGAALNQYIKAGGFPYRRLR
jgi:hypothetical protein